jgi:hypothetical protein
MTQQYDDDDLTDYVDMSRTTRLHDQGSPFYATIVVDIDGNEHWLLADPRDRSEYAPDCDDVAHEHLGALPKEWLDRIWSGLQAGDVCYCGRRNRHGKPCRQIVASFGQACQWHHDVNNKTPA